MNAVVAWVLAFLLAKAPPGRPVGYPAAKETPEETESRYKSIAEDLVAVVYDPDEVPIFDGEQGRAKTTAIMGGIAFYESAGFRKDVDLGIAPTGRGDHGRSVCLMQIMVGSGRAPDYNIVKHRLAWWGDPPSEVVKGYNADELLKDRKNCFRAGLHMARNSFHACANLPLSLRLTVYTSGSCTKGKRESYARVMLGLHWLNESPPMFFDENAI